MSNIKVLKFGAPWCGPCKMLDPALDELKQELTDVEFESVDVDTQPEKAAEWEVMSVPSVFILKDDEVVDNFVGFRPKEFVEDLVKAYM